MGGSGTIGLHRTQHVLSEGDSLGLLLDAAFMLIVMATRRMV